MNTTRIALIIVLGSFSVVAGIFLPAIFQNTSTDGTDEPVCRLENYHLIILLDLSDRISPQKHPAQAQADKAIIKTIVGVFEREVRKKFYLTSKDCLSIVVAHQPQTGYNSQLPQLLNKLRLNLNNPSLIVSKPKFDQMKGELLEALDTLYEKAVANKRFAGADIWSFFSYSLQDYMVGESGDGVPYRNVLIVLTDGYLNFDKKTPAMRLQQGNRTSYMQVSYFRKLSGDWEKRFDEGDYGLISAKSKQDLGKLEVLILEISLRHPIDRPIIMKYWTKWLTEMGVKKFELKTGGYAPDHTAEIIRRFLQSG